MSSTLPPALEDLIQELSRLPGVGPKTAQRLAFHVLRLGPERAQALAGAIQAVTERIGYCDRCHNLAEEALCAICAAPRRDQSVICVVESPIHLLAIERTGEYRGLYFVLHGVLSPIDGIGPDELRVKELMTRLSDGAVTELILATDPNLEGEATATYLARLVKPLGVRVTRPASGLPVGGDLEYADEVTLGRAFQGRRMLDV